MTGAFPITRTLDRGATFFLLLIAAVAVAVPALNLLTLVALFRGTLADDDLVVGAVSEEVALVDGHDKAARP